MLLIEYCGFTPADRAHGDQATPYQLYAVIENTLITGWNGFFGSILCSKLNANDANILRCGRVPGSDIKTDLSLAAPKIKGSLKRVIHSAGVTPSPSRSVNTEDKFNIGNVKTTSNLLKGLTSNKPESFALISSVSVYGKVSGDFIDEVSPLLASSGYARSKLESELLVAEWCDKHNVDLTIVRLPLVVGNGVQGTFGQLINAIRKRHFVIPGDGSARKSMVLANDVADWLLNNPSVTGTFNLTDQVDPTFAEVCSAITNHLKLKKVPRVPEPLMLATSWVGSMGSAVLSKPLPYNSTVHKQLTESLTFSSLAALPLGWNPTPVLSDIDNWLSDQVISTNRDIEFKNAA